MAGGLVSISGLQLRTLHTSPVRSTTSSSSLPGFVIKSHMNLGCAAGQRLPPSSSDDALHAAER